MILGVRKTMEIKGLKQNLSDAGCPDEVAKDIIKMCEAGNTEGALHLMKKDRCRLIQELHESGRKVDRLDFLIRSTEKEIKDRQ